MAVTSGEASYVRWRIPPTALTHRRTAPPHDRSACHVMHGGSFIPMGNKGVSRPEAGTRRAHASLRRGRAGGRSLARCRTASRSCAAATGSPTSSGARRSRRRRTSGSPRSRSSSRPRRSSCSAEDGQPRARRRRAEVAAGAAAGGRRGHDPPAAHAHLRPRRLRRRHPGVDDRTAPRRGRAGVARDPGPHVLPAGHARIATATAATRCSPSSSSAPPAGRSPSSCGSASSCRSAWRGPWRTRKASPRSATGPTATATSNGPGSARTRARRARSSATAASTRRSTTWRSGMPRSTTTGCSVRNRAGSRSRRRRPPTTRRSRTASAGESRAIRVWHSGETAGFRNVIVRFPERRLTIVILTNRDAGEPYRAALAIAELDRPVGLTENTRKIST